MSDPMEIDDAPRRLVPIPLPMAPLFSETGLPRRLSDRDTVGSPSRVLPPPFDSSLPPGFIRPWDKTPFLDPRFVGPCGLDLETFGVFDPDVRDFYKLDAMETDDVPEFIRNAPLPDFIRNALPKVIRYDRPFFL